MLSAIQQNPHFLSLIEIIDSGSEIKSLGLIRPVRIPMVAALKTTIERPIIVIVERMDQAIAFSDEIGFWMRAEDVLLFPEPSPTFYEKAAWGSLTRRDRLQTLTYLANYHLPNSKKNDPKVIITTVRGLMTRTIPLHRLGRCYSYSCPKEKSFYLQIRLHTYCSLHGCQ